MGEDGVSCGGVQESQQMPGKNLAQQGADNVNFAQTLAVVTKQHATQHGSSGNADLGPYQARSSVPQRAAAHNAEAESPLLCLGLHPHWSRCQAEVPQLLCPEDTSYIATLHNMYCSHAWSCMSWLLPQ